MYPEEITLDYFIISLCACKMRAEKEKFLAKTCMAMNFCNKLKFPQMCTTLAMCGIFCSVFNTLAYPRVALNKHQTSRVVAGGGGGRGGGGGGRPLGGGPRNLKKGGERIF